MLYFSLYLARWRRGMCDYLNADGTPCKNPGHCHVHGPNNKSRKRAPRPKQRSHRFKNILEHTVAILMATFVLSVPSLTKDAVVAFKSSPQSPAVTTVELLPPGPVGNLKATAWTVDPSRLQENLSHSDTLTVAVTRATPAATEIVNGIDPNSVLGCLLFRGPGNPFPMQWQR